MQASSRPTRTGSIAARPRCSPRHGKTGVIPSYSDGLHCGRRGQGGRACAVRSSRPTRTGSIAALTPRRPRSRRSAGHPVLLGRAPLRQVKGVTHWSVEVEGHPVLLGRAPLRPPRRRVLFQPRIRHPVLLGRAPLRLSALARALAQWGAVIPSYSDGLHCGVTGETPSLAKLNRHPVLLGRAPLRPIAPAPAAVPTGCHPVLLGRAPLRRVRHGLAPSILSRSSRPTRTGSIAAEDGVLLGQPAAASSRSEKRRVGKEGRS